MAENRGKDFESRIKEAFLNLTDCAILRLIDPQNGFAGVRNICDFVAYDYPKMYLLECKSCHGNTLSFGNITENQWSGLLEYSKVYGIVAGYMIWFIDRDTTIFITATGANKIKASGNKSIHVDNFESLLTSDDYMYIPGKKKRVFFDYDIRPFVEKFGRQL